MSLRGSRATRFVVGVAAVGVFATACSAQGDTAASLATSAPWSTVEQNAEGKTVSLWMWGGDPKGNAYVDDVLTPAAAEKGVTLRRVPIADTQDAMNRILAEKQAGRQDGSVDLVWINGDNFRTGVQADLWRCNWSQALPNMEFTKPDDPLLTTDFGTPVNGCEAPWSKAQFTFAYDSEKVPDPPSTLAGVLDWASDHPGKFAYPAPPDFTGAVFVREVLYSTAGGYQNVPSEFSQEAYDRLTPALWERLNKLKPALWRNGDTYPRDSTKLDDLFGGRQVDFTMTYGPATLTSLVEKGTFPESTKVLTLNEGTVGNASFLAIPATSGVADAAMVVANLALSAEQQLAKAKPSIWGQFTVLDVARLPKQQADEFAELGATAVVPSYAELSANANPELSAEWVSALDDGWREYVLNGSGE